MTVDNAVSVLMSKWGAATSDIPQGLVHGAVVFATFFSGLSDKKPSMTWQYAPAAQKSVVSWAATKAAWASQER